MRKPQKNEKENILIRTQGGKVQHVPSISSSSCSSSISIRGRNLLLNIKIWILSFRKCRLRGYLTLEQRWGIFFFFFFQLSLSEEIVKKTRGSSYEVIRTMHLLTAWVQKKNPWHSAALTWWNPATCWKRNFWMLIRPLAENDFIK